MTGKDTTRSDKFDKNSMQTRVSLRILDKLDNGTWIIHEPAKLPKIEHGQTEDSVVIHDLSITEKIGIKAKGDIILNAGDGDSEPGGTISAEAINAKTITQNGSKVPTIKLSNIGDTYYQLQISGVD